uniref:E3 ubiquitin-protein ligase CHFR n=1 Tax=Arion vulgaris TaxID=1028688 RepID=A0A0B7AFR9_9EUPU
MTEVVPCLLRVSDNAKKYRIIKLEKDQVTIGRSDVTFAILSSMISRCHAIIRRQEDNSWTIADNKSLNGTHVNGQQLVPFIPSTLQDGDMVQFGIPTKSNLPAEFVFKFYSSLRVRIVKAEAKRLKLDSTVSEDKDTLSASELNEVEDDSKRKRKIACDRFKVHAKTNESPSKSIRHLMEKSQKEHMTKEAEYLSRLAEMERLLKEKEDYQRQVQKELERERKENENQAKEVEELRLKEQAILQEMQEKQKHLEREREDLKKTMQAELEAHVKEREKALLFQLATQRDILLTEKKQIEESIQKEMEKALEEKNKELEQQLFNQKQKLEKVLEKKDMEQKLLESQLSETKKESATAKLQALKAREDVLSNFVQLMEVELQCAICNELFVKATSLNCAHVFCKLCINQWMKVKKECPNCRAPITSQMQALALDSYIDKMVEQLNDEMKQRRAELVEQRKIEQDKFDGVVAGPSSAPRAVTARITRNRRPNITSGAIPIPQSASTTTAVPQSTSRTSSRVTATTTPSGVTSDTTVIELLDDSNTSNNTEDIDDDDDDDLILYH